MTYSAGSTQLGNLTYTYDADGRRTSNGGSLAAVTLPSAVSGNTFNADSGMTNGTTLSYDANGNLTGDGTNTYTWNARNNLSAISGGSTASFVYDALGRRASKSINSSVTQFLYDGWNPVQELNGATPAAATANLLTGLNVDEYFTRTASGTTSTLLADALGSTIGLVGSAGSIATSYTYQPFGAATIGGSANANSYEFTGRENDGAGLYFYRARYYSPSFQRFIAQDPSDFEAGDANLYSYVHNRPTVLTDPRGLQDVIPVPEEGPLEIPGGAAEPPGTNLDPPQPPSSCSGGQPDLNKCLDAAGGPESWGDFCRSLQDPAQRRGCWSHSYSTSTEQKNWCYGQFMT